MRQFNDYLTLHNRLTRHQSGNRSLHSTETLSLLVTDDISRVMDSRQTTAMVLIDLSKAFDSLSFYPTQQTPTAGQLREGTPLVQELPVRQTAVYSNWNIIVESPNDNSWVHLRPVAVYTLYE